MKGENHLIPKEDPNTSLKLSFQVNRSLVSCFSDSIPCEMEQAVKWNVLS